jgi:hypothetical protein
MRTGGSAFLETAMHAHKGHAHYAPSLVGALIDPAFVRGAAMDANEERRAERTRPPSLRLRWAGAIHAIAVALRRH